MRRLPKITRRRFLAGMLGVGLGSFVWMRFIEPRWIKVTERTIPLGLGGKSLRLLHLSDFHADPMPLSYLGESIDTALTLKPDLICLTGDFITAQFSEWTRYTELLAKLPKIAPTFAILGNHDGGAWVIRLGGYPNADRVRQMLDDAGIRLLYNERTSFESGGARLTLVGLGDWWADELRANTAFEGYVRDPSIPTLVLSHNPDTKQKLATYPWDLMLSGHTHGGQLLLPMIGTPFAPVRDKRYVRDLHRIDDRWLYITAGVGALHSMRFNCRPEISLLNLV